MFFCRQRSPIAEPRALSVFCFLAIKSSQLQFGKLAMSNKDDLPLVHFRKEKRYVLLVKIKRRKWSQITNDMSKLLLNKCNIICLKDYWFLEFLITRCMHVEFKIVKWKYSNHPCYNNKKKNIIFHIEIQWSYTYKSHIINLTFEWWQVRGRIELNMFGWLEWCMTWKWPLIPMRAT